MQIWLTANAVANGDIHPQGDIDLKNCDVNHCGYYPVDKKL